MALCEMSIYVILLSYRKGVRQIHFAPIIQSMTPLSRPGSEAVNYIGTT